MALLGAPLLHALAVVDDASAWRSLRELQLEDGAAELAARVSARVLQLLGEPLAAADHRRVERRPARAWLPGEIVAVEGARGELRYARVLEEDAEEAEACGSDVKVQVSRACIRWYPASQILFFPSALDAEASSSCQPQLEADTDKTVLSAMTVLKSDQSGKWDTEDVVGAANVAAAVSALLARLNLSLSASHLEMLNEMQNLHVRATLAEENHRAALRRIETLLREKHAAQKLVACAVCMDQGIDCALVPCGHVFCGKCVQRLQPAACPVCRQEFTGSAVVRLP